MDMKFYKKLLQARKNELKEMNDASAESRKTIELDQTSVGRLSRMDALQGQAMNNAIAERRKLALLKVEGALKRMQDDNFGYCLKCGEEISEKRLNFDPATLYCSDCLGK
mgnify:CR=1 FL=1